MSKEMAHIDLRLDGDGAWAKDEKRNMIYAGAGLSLALLQDGTEGGNPVVMLRLELPDGKTYVVGQTTLRLLSGAVRTMEARTNV